MSLVVLEITVVISKQSIKIKSETSDSFLLERKKEGYNFRFGAEPCTRQRKNSMKLLRSSKERARRKASDLAV
ncbi:hypothetical protein V6N12_069151 [Hibiscus sabdariffa]|uniref:Uncharacterized protein n=1 Tax=Hibiscus sabdariffa TaxID=183260 RepID=A0ABR2FCZ6_9ROSI